ncbi:MAG: AEC family transporter [Shimia sp.]
MQTLLSVILPVFLVIGAGYGATRMGWFRDDYVDALMHFTQTFAIPALLFLAISSLDLSAGLDPALLGAYYAGAASAFVALMLAARALGRPWEDAVAIGFIGLFSNLVLLGLPISERAFGTPALQFNYAIIAVNAPICYGIGITVMEVVRARGTPARALPRKVLSAMFHNALVIGIALGFAVNLSGLALPAWFTDGAELLAAGALPAALFGLGGVLVRYKPEGDLRLVGLLCAVTLILTPALVYTLGRAFGLSGQPLATAVICAAMAPGVNTYVFANMYEVARRVAATTVLATTGLSVLSLWAWLALLG